MKETLNRILVKGGLLTPIELMRIIELLNESGINHFHFGSRQDILFHCDIPVENLDHRFSSIKLQHFKNRKYQNITCSYLSADIFNTTPWLTGATYLYILERFRYNPVLKVNLADPRQQIVPLYYSHLNFLASDYEDYWYLHLNIPEHGLKGFFPVLLFSWDLPKVAQYIEENYTDFDSVEELFRESMSETKAKSRIYKDRLKVSYVPFPYYEGMNKMGYDQYWLGLYWRDNRYDLNFLREMCTLCIESKVGKICITPWKSFIVKGIPAQDKLIWEKFMGRHGINVRHSSLELNWHLPVCDQEALDLKNYIVSIFDKHDISTYGLTFSISSGRSIDFTSIIIRKNPTPESAPKQNYRPGYTILYAKHFDPNQMEYITYCQDIDQMELPGMLIELSKEYYTQLGEKQEITEEKTEIFIDPVDTAVLGHRCSTCYTTYDSTYGDVTQDIPINTLFQNLPENYLCPVCEGPKSDFVQLQH